MPSPAHLKKPCASWGSSTGSLVGNLFLIKGKKLRTCWLIFGFMVNQRDEEAFKRIINLPKRGIGDTTVAKIAVTAL